MRQLRITVGLLPTTVSPRPIRVRLGHLLHLPRVTTVSTPQPKRVSPPPIRVSLGHLLAPPMRRSPRLTTVNPPRAIRVSLGQTEGSLRPTTEDPTLKGQWVVMNHLLLLLLLTRASRRHLPQERPLP